MAAYKNILIALPTVSQALKVGTALTIVEVVRELAASGVNAQLHNIDSAEIVTARDMFANMVLHSDAWDAILFIDSDMAFKADLVQRMVFHGGNVVAAACPRRSLDLNRLIAGAQSHGNLPRALAQASDFTVRFDWEDSAAVAGDVADGFCRADAVGMACALISKEALHAMVEAGAVTPRADLNAGPGRTCWSFFGIYETDGERLGEDYSFCYRWTKLMKQPLWVCIDEEVSHIGHFDYHARFSDLL